LQRETRLASGVRPIEIATEHALRETAPDKTSVFAHPVECFVSNFAGKDTLKRMPLKIGEHTASYGAFFKKIEYLQDNKGLIYWGKIKEIKDDTQSFRIDFEQTFGCSVPILRTWINSSFVRRRGWRVNRHWLGRRSQ
jgi:hypothetical protein